MLIAAIEDDDPVVFFEPKRLYNGPFDGHHDRPVTPWGNHPLGEVPKEYYKVPLGVASIVRPGSDVTVVAYGTMVHVALAAAADDQRAAVAQGDGGVVVARGRQRRGGPLPRLTAAHRRDPGPAAI